MNSAQGGFSLRYPADFVKVEPPADTKSDPGLVYQAFLADPTGARSGETALDVLGVTVMRMTAEAKSGDLKKYKAQFETMAGELMGRPDGLKRVTPFTVTELNGRAALSTTYVYKVGGTDVGALTYLVPAGQRVFWLTGQASQKTWATSGQTIGASLATFSVEQ